MATLLLDVGAAAGEPRVIAVAGGSVCPTPGALAVAVAGVIPGAQVTIGTAESGALAVEIADEGDSYRVSVASMERILADPARNCRDRARSASVVVALLVDTLGSEAATATAPPPREYNPPQAPAESPRGGRRIHGELDARLGLALASGFGQPQVAPSGSADVRLALMGRHAGVALGVGADLPLTLSFGNAQARLTRAWLDLSLRLAWRRGRVELSGDAGLSAVLLIIEGLQLEGGSRTTRVDAGARLALQVRLWLHDRWALSAGPDVTVCPFVQDVLVEPAGRVGTTPRLWIGASAGVTSRF